MEHEGYYLISCDDDGDICVTPYTKEGLLAHLAEDAPPEGFLSTVTHSHPHRWCGQQLLIKGRIVQPTEKQVVVEFDVP